MAVCDVDATFAGLFPSCTWTLGVMERCRVHTASVDDTRSVESQDRVGVIYGCISLSGAIYVCMFIGLTLQGFKTEVR